MYICICVIHSSMTFITSPAGEEGVLLPALQQRLPDARTRPLGPNNTTTTTTTTTNTTTTTKMIIIMILIIQMI